MHYQFMKSGMEFEHLHALLTTRVKSDEDKDESMKIFLNANPVFP